MGMDVYGKNATSETGKYFRRSIWSWRPLAEFIVLKGPPEIVDKCDAWQTNDCEGLTGRDSRKLADVLQQMIDSGAVKAYVEWRDTLLADLPDVPCDLCGATGTRIWVKDNRAGMPPGPRECNGCAGKGKIRPPETWYPFEENDVVEWIAFLRDCGGFEIC